MSERKCKNCGKQLQKWQSFYCSNDCQQIYQQKEYIQRWKNNQESGLSGEYQLSKYIVHYLLEKNNYQCEKCGWGELNIFTNKIPLEIHHKDGDHSNNKEENLQVLCPNCHALTENYKSRGKGRADRAKYYKTNICIDCGAIICNTSIRCVECQRKFQQEESLKKLPISREELKARIRVESFESIGREYNISGNGLKRWCTKYQLPNTKTEIKQYTEEEWEKI